MMVVMWALAASVLLGAWFLTTRRQGLVWPALAWMAATLFALAAFRNTAPGTPPIGCVMDWFAFFWAETVIALCLIIVVTAGIRTALRAGDDRPA
jgi:nitric oxide reductase large subunit